MSAQSHDRLIDFTSGNSCWERDLGARLNEGYADLNRFNYWYMFLFLRSKIACCWTCSRLLHYGRVHALSLVSGGIPVDWFALMHHLESCEPDPGCQQANGCDCMSLDFYLEGHVGRVYARDTYNYGLNRMRVL
jgi:hypothetical protein